ncbi:hypothetical protein DFJ73DRAFT_901076 [Zopfochytrium polystomum]|nr:hypothetical protein DFJ73DRAFT_901076 [Zopfochytrium polystomum]
MNPTAPAAAVLAGDQGEGRRRESEQQRLRLWTSESHDAWLRLLGDALRLRPCAAGSSAGPGGDASTAAPDGLKKLSILIESLLAARGFTVRRISPDPLQYPLAASADILVATRPPRRDGAVCSDGHWVGLIGHYDVETVDRSRSEGPPSNGWSTPDPWTPTERDGRVYARGVADNLGPLLQRILLIPPEDAAQRDGAGAATPPSTAQQLANTAPGLLWLLHGEEETAGRFPHAVYPALAADPSHPRPLLWLEETGYFATRDGVAGPQRVLAMPPVGGACETSGVLPAVLDAVAAAGAAGGLVVEERYLNKAFGTAACPGLTHVVGPARAEGRAAYIAIGPNDKMANIHGVDESLRLDCLAVAAEQFAAVLEAVAKC